MSLQKVLDESKDMEKKIAEMAMGDIVPLLAKTGSRKLDGMRVQYNHRGGPEGIVVGWIDKNRLIVRVDSANYAKMGNYYWYTAYQAREEFTRIGTDKSWHNVILLDAVEGKKFRYVMMSPANLMGVKPDANAPSQDTKDRIKEHLKAEEAADKLKQAAKDPADLSDDMQIVRERLYENYGISPVMQFAEIHMRLLRELEVYKGDDAHCRFCGAHKGGEQHAAKCTFIVAYNLEADKVNAEIAKNTRKRIPQSRNAFLQTFATRMPPMKRVEFCQLLVPQIEE